MILRFLGTGGGRYVTAEQIRRTGGFLVMYEDTIIHVDPGPGALLLLNRIMRPYNLSGVLVSHNHTDHVNDVPALIEGITLRGGKKVFAGSRNVFEYSDRYSPLSKYHLSLPEKAFCVEPGDSFRVSSLTITATPTKHDEESGVGFVFSGDSKVAYLSDTGYREDLKDYLEDTDVLIFNLISYSVDDIPHTNLYAVRRILSDVRPRTVLLQHFGAKILFRGLSGMLARKIENEFNVRAVALKDGETFSTTEECGNKRITEYLDA